VKNGTHWVIGLVNVRSTNRLVQVLQVLLQVVRLLLLQVQVVRLLLHQVRVLPRRNQGVTLHAISAVNIKKDIREISSLNLNG